MLKILFVNIAGDALEEWDSDQIPAVGDFVHIENLPYGVIGRSWQEPGVVVLTLNTRV